MAKTTRPPINPPAPVVAASDDPLESAAHWVQANGKLVGIGVAVVAAVGLGIAGLRASEAKKAANASTALYAAQAPLYENKTDVARTALEGVASRYSGTSAGQQAVLLLAQTYYDSGEFAEGIAKLEAARGSAASAFRPSMDALMAAGYEGMANFEKAAEQYANAAKSAGTETERDGYRLSQARALVLANKQTEAVALFKSLMSDEGSAYAQEAAVRLGELQAVGGAS
jgi:tetratricopeptide (TPR) repeat protein